MGFKRPRWWNVLLRVDRLTFKLMVVTSIQDFLIPKENLRYNYVWFILSDLVIIALKLLWYAFHGVSDLQNLELVLEIHWWENYTELRLLLFFLWFRNRRELAISTFFHFWTKYLTLYLKQLWLMVFEKWKIYSFYPHTSIPLLHNMSIFEGAFLHRYLSN
jgi:hypothetical protein